MDNRFDKIEEKLDNIQKEIHEIAVEHAQRITKLETNQKGFISIFSILLTAVVGYVASVFNLRS